MNRKAKISQCMIVKNEEENIERALSWGKGIVSEQIVVDTGSTDRTVELARQMGATVYDFEWIDDFSAAKNYAINKARYEWVAFLDADEYFTEEDAKKLLCYVQDLQDTSCNGIQTAWVNLDANGKIMGILTQIRVFRNLKILRYKDRIHEYLALEDGRPLEAIDAVNELFIYHTGYSRENHKKKERRNIRLIQKELEENPDDYRMLGYLGKEYMLMEAYEQAEAAFRKALQYIPDSRKHDYNGTTSEIALRLLILLTMLPEDRERDVRELYRQAVECWPEEADYDYTIAKYFIAQEKYQDGERHLKQALERLEKYGYREKSMILSAEVPKAYEILAVCCYNNGDLAGCVNYTTAILKENPYLVSTLTVLLLAFCKDAAVSGKKTEKALELVSFLGKAFYDFQTLKDRIFVLRAAMASDYRELTEVVRELFSSEELEAVDQSLSIGNGK